MTKQEVLHILPGFYRVYWKDGGTSLAAVGVGRDGTRWLAPLNWVAPVLDGSHWAKVSRVSRPPWYPDD